VQTQLQVVDTIYSNGYAFAAKLTDGRVVTWGLADHGGDSSSVQAQLQRVDAIYSTCYAFAAKQADGRIVTWGGVGTGGRGLGRGHILVNCRRWTQSARLIPPSLQS
jgi:hypothetical protein